MVVSLAVDATALVAIVWRFLAIGLWTSHVIVLGTNVVLLGFLGGAAFAEYRRLTDQDRSTDALNSWMAGYLPVFMAWAAFVGLVVPLYRSSPAMAGH